MPVYHEFWSRNELILDVIQAKIDEDESYLQFFQDRYVLIQAPYFDEHFMTKLRSTRIKLEEEYINGLNKLYNRSKAIDTLHDE